MQDRKYRVLTCFFPYGGTGDSPKEHPAIRDWFAKTVRWLDKSPLVYDHLWKDFSDTPITMTRNAAVMFARKVQADILVMVDSDMVPDMYLTPKYGTGSPHAAGAKPFIEVAIDSIHQHYDAGPIAVGAPYCGPPPYENVYVFDWEINGDSASSYAKLRQLARNEAAIRSGVGRVAALPTGLIAFDMRAFKFVEPKPGDEGFFYYRYSDHYQTKKDGTEDVMLTRDMSLAIQRELGYEPMFCAWDSWAGHVKPWVVGKPTIIFTDQVERKYRQAVLDGLSSNERMVDVNALDESLVAPPVPMSCLREPSQEAT